MSFRPLHDIVVVRQDGAQTQTPSGLFLPPSAAEKPKTGEVLAVGPGRAMVDGSTLRTDFVAPGDRVVLPDSHGVEHELEPWGKVLFVAAGEILAVLEA